MANQDSSKSSVGLPAGTRIGKYEVVERLAMGGQAVIYRCHDPFLDRQVAIKQISTHLAEDEKFLERFRKEAQILARLGSEQPAIVTIHEMIEDEKGLFIVMEFVKGPTLEQVLQDTEGPTQTKAVLQLLWRLAAALYDVHDAGIVHRDLKPANIIVAEGLHPKIADFGVAASSTGQESMVLGTTKYMAPELYGDGPVDGRADMYSLGFIMYELLIGRPQFEDVFADVIRDRHSEALRWMKWHGNKDLKAPSPHELNPSVPRELSHIVMKMIAKDPRERYENMEALGRAIKVGFSSKGKGAAAAGRQRRRGGARTAAASSAAGAGMELDDSGILPADEPTPELTARRRQRNGDHEPELEEPATAPVPKSSLSRKTKLILAAVIVLAIVGIGIVVGVRRSQEELTYQQRVEQAYSKAMDNYQKTNYEAAAKGFQTVVSKYPDTTEAVKASVLVHLARGYMAVEKGEKDLAQESKIKARSRQIEVQRKASGELLEWTRDIAGQITQLEDYHSAVFAFRAAEDRVQALIDQGRFQDARLELRVAANQLGPQAKVFHGRITQLQREIDRLEFTSEMNTAVGIADKLADKEQFAAAQTAYSEGAEKLATSDRAALLAPDKKQELETYLKTRAAEMGSYKDYTEAMTAANRARDAGDKAKELQSLQKAEKVRSSPELKKRIKLVESDYYLQVANRALSDGQTKEAERLYVKALQINPDNRRAQDALDSLNENAEYAKLVAAGDTAMIAKEYEKALEKYMEARKIRSPGDLDEKIVTCQFQIQLAKANQLRAEEKFDEAKAAYEKAAAIKESEAARVEALQVAMAQERQYKSLMDKGDALMEDGSYKKAIEEYEKAGKVYATAPQEVNDRIRRGKYEINLALGKEALEENNTTSAKAYFRLAQAQVDTEEIRQLLQKADSSGEGDSE